MTMQENDRRNPFTAFLKPRLKTVAKAAQRRSRISRTVAKRKSRRRRPVQRAFTAGPETLGPVNRVVPIPRPGLVEEIFGGVVKAFKGEATFPLPGVGMAGRAMQLRAIGRQNLAKVPFGVKAAGAAGAGIGAATGFEALTGVSPARVVHNVGRELLGGSRPRRQQMPRGGGLAVGSELPPSHVVVRTWQTFPGGPVFARLADGHIAVQKKDGTIKHFRPYRPVVIPRKWNARSMSRVATALKRQRKTATKIMQMTGGMPKGRK